MYHYRKTRRTYSRHNSSDRKRTGCTFCNSFEEGANVVYEGETMVIVPNRVSYDLFEGRTVTEHYMVIPKRHIESLDGFSDEEALEMFRLTAAYERKGYNVYARGKGSVTRSVLHQHTHLIKTTDKRNKLLFYVRRPYFLIKL